MRQQLTNNTAYQTAAIVRHYIEATELFPPEKTVLDLLQHDLPHMAMLDIGVGAGRTTLHFARAVRSYLGIDYSPSMVEACTRRFAGTSASTTFRLCDVRDMATIPESSFDFVLASNNALDYIGLGDRHEALSEIKRVGKSGGFFFLCSHNLQNLPGRFEFDWRFDRHVIGRIREAVTLRIANRMFGSKSVKALRSASRLVVNDGSLGFRLRTAYLQPAVQLDDLTDAGFRDIRVYSLHDGRELDIGHELAVTIDRSLHYLSRI
jgi:ubiquinone/menaquinone biosynthesis C-methylase UbiE